MAKPAMPAWAALQQSKVDKSWDNLRTRAGQARKNRGKVSGQVVEKPLDKWRHKACTSPV
jgi:hypothetical protein